MKKYRVLLLLIFSFLNQSWAEEKAVDLLNKGDAEFRQAMSSKASYLDAASLYSRAISELDAPPASLIYNLGNSFFLEGYYSEAYIAYSKAHYLDPWNKDIKENRDLVMKKLNIQDRKNTPLQLILWFFPLMLGTYRAWFLLIIILLFTTALLIYLRVSKKYISFPLFLALQGVCIVLFISNVSWNIHDRSTSYLMGESSTVRKGDSKLFESLDDVKRGTRLYILKTDHDWSKVKIAGTGQSGWVEGLDIMTFDELIDKFQ